jgi:hypothetical protein
MENQDQVPPEVAFLSDRELTEDEKLKGAVIEADIYGDIVWRWTFSLHFKLPGRESPHVMDNIILAMMRPRHSVYYTTKDFMEARKASAKVGILLYDIERWPIFKPEHIRMIPEECILDEPTEHELAEMNSTDPEWEHYRQLHHDWDHEEFM